MNEILNNKKRSEVLAEKLMEMNYGDIIKHEQIAEVINVNYPSNAYTTTIVHMAHPNGRLCGAKRPKCEAERSSPL